MYNVMSLGKLPVYKIICVGHALINVKRFDWLEFKPSDLIGADETSY